MTDLGPTEVLLSYLRRAVQLYDSDAGLISCVPVTDEQSFPQERVLYSLVA